MHSKIAVLIGLFALNTIAKTNAMDSIVVHIKVKHEYKFNEIKSKGDYSLKLSINDSTQVKLHPVIDGLTYINDTVVSVEKYRIEVVPINYFLSKYRVRRKHFIIYSTKREKAITVSYKRQRYGLRNLLIRLRMKQDHCHNSSVW
ncbi:MAG TPA: hypothetical protein VK796_01450 [Cytophaga sp.]|jgi:hypothetical protein|nr:hypothetical protein [Cytophaga sp.]